MKQANENYQNWQDRHDVDKAFNEWDDGILSFGWSEGFMYTEMQIKAFATFFAERVKGAPLSSSENPNTCDHYFARKADGTLMPCEFCGGEKSKVPECQSCHKTTLIENGVCNFCGGEQ